MDDEELLLVGAAVALWLLTRSASVSVDEASPGEGEGGGGFSADDREALARVLTSELGSGSDEERRAIGWCVRTRAAISGKSVYEMEAPGGSYGEQGASPPRPFSSRQSPSSRDRTLADEILSAASSDNPYPDAAQFFEPGAQDTLFQQGVKYRAAGGACKDQQPQGASPQFFRARCYFHDAQSIRDKWSGEGASPVATVGRIELWTLA